MAVFQHAPLQEMNSLLNAGNGGNGNGNGGGNGPSRRSLFLQGLADGVDVTVLEGLEELQSILDNEVSFELCRCYHSCRRSLFVFGLVCPCPSRRSLLLQGLADGVDVTILEGLEELQSILDNEVSPHTFLMSQL